MRDIGKGISVLGICGLGAMSMYITGGEIGVGWAIFGVFIIWAL